MIQMKGITKKKVENYKEQGPHEYSNLKDKINDSLKNFLQYINNLQLIISIRENDALSRFLSKIKDSKPIQWLVIYKDTIASLLFKLWIVGCGYWIYQFIIIKPQKHCKFFINAGTMDPTEALVFLFFGSIAWFFLVIIALYLIKFFYNLIWDKIKYQFPEEWHSFIASLTLLILLWFSFPLIETVKITSQSVYYQVTEIARTAKNRNIIIKTKPPNLIKFY